MKKYLAWACIEQIEPVEIVRETNSSVFIACDAAWAAGGVRREAKRSEGRGYFDTWEDARQFMLSELSAEIATKTRQIAEWERRCKKIEEMTE